jgi:hypothetical protein
MTIIYENSIAGLASCAPHASSLNQKKFKNE